MSNTNLAEEGMPAIEDFAAMLEESYGAGSSLEGTVLKALLSISKKISPSLMLV